MFRCFNFDLIIIFQSLFLRVALDFQKSSVHLNMNSSSVSSQQFVSNCRFGAGVAHRICILVDAKSSFKDL